MSASDIMIERYGIPPKDVPHYKADHLRLEASAIYLGTSAGLFASVILALIDFWITPIIDILGILSSVGILTLILSWYYLYQAKQGGQP